MDPISQAGLGAVVAQTLGYRQLGVKAAVLGAGVGAMPDVDVLFSIGGDFFDQLVTHRGITHSLFFTALVGPALGWSIWYLEQCRDPTVDRDRRHRWMLVTTLALLSHPLLDVLTPYGTQLLLPLSDARFAINAMPIIDPIYTGLLLAGLILAWTAHRRGSNKVEIVTGLALLVSSTYLGYGWLQHERAHDAASRQLADKGIDVQRISAFPTILQVHLRRVVARSATVDRVGFYSTWSPCEIEWFESPRAGVETYAPFLETREGRIFDWFTMGWAHYGVEAASHGYRLTASDLRYGFDDRPFESIFSVSAPLGPALGLAGPAVAGRAWPDDSDSALARLVERTYAPACRIFSKGGNPNPINDNAG